MVEMEMEMEMEVVAAVVMVMEMVMEMEVVAAVVMVMEMVKEMKVEVVEDEVEVVMSCCHQRPCQSKDVLFQMMEIWIVVNRVG